MGDLHLNGKEFNFDTNKNISKDELANKNGINVEKLETVFVEYDGIKLANGLSAKEAQTIINLFDANDDKKITDDEVTDAKIKEFIKQNGGNAEDTSLLGSMKNLITAVANTFGKDGGFYNVTDTNGNVTEKYTLETNNGVTKKTHYSTDGTKNNRIAEQWEAGFKNYRKEWTGPNGERTLLEGTAVKDNGDGTYTLTVKRTDSRFPDTTYEMVFDKNGQELSRTDANGNKYNSYGAPLNGTEGAGAANNAPATENQAEEKTVVVEKWAKGVTNSTLSGIITSAYGVKAGTEEYKAIEKMVMDANPEIYGDENGNGGRKRILDGTRHNAVIHPGDTLKLPPYNGKTAAPAEGGATTPAPATGRNTPAPKNQTGPATGRALNKNKQYTRTKLGYNVSEALEDGSRKISRYAEKVDKPILLSETLYKGNQEITTEYSGTSKTETTYEYDENDSKYQIRQVKYENGKKVSTIETKKVNDYAGKVRDDMKNDGLTLTFVNIMNDASLSLDDLGLILERSGGTTFESKLGFATPQLKMQHKSAFSKILARSSQSERTEFMAKHITFYNLMMK